MLGEAQGTIGARNQASTAGHVLAPSGLEARKSCTANFAGAFCTPASVPIPKFANPCGTTDANFGVEGH